MMRFFKRVGRFILKACIWFFALSIGLVIIYRFVPVPITPLMVVRLVEQAASEDRNMKLSKDWVPMEEISKQAPQAVYASEDQKFLEHHGFDIEAMKKAWEGNQQGKRIKGASTITQQTVKNVFLWQGRNYLRKGLEAYFTVLVELLWSKERIMEVYLNVIEMGDGIYGIEAASQEFYNKPASNLTKSEAALIAAVLPNPLRWSPTRPTGYNRQRQTWIMRQMSNLKPLDWGK